ncbi:uncharacterized protein N7506_010562 [Penicillium brevicompactum]|uniref:uncharacterized protein n=1 Tax=Penicillium brevicompactum TaxID=5074 RepID=UPI0025407186|nr:uncharacterized protein N7506_010562 [Penicillium brevicompactum]KAJ5327460.1 hypothetical protein N7506_010562 [Penicillium brevicompactum]
MANTDDPIEELQTQPPISSLLLEKLPYELIHVIISFLPAPDLACVGATCRALADHALNDLLWADLVNARLPTRIKDPGIFKSFRRLYLAYYPCWFIPEHKIWFADNEPTGTLILARYDNRRGVIEGYQIVAERGHPVFHLWKAELSVLVQAFDPIVRLSLDDPVLFLKDPDPSNKTAIIQHSSQRKDRRMPLALDAHHVHSSLSFCAAISDGLHPDIESTQYWPPPMIPSSTRTMRTKENGQRRAVESMSELSEKFFCINKWTSLPVAFSPNNGQCQRIYSTLDPALYTPTKNKPYQGIWVGDYSTHGCEFLLVLQGEEYGTSEVDPEEEIGQRGSLRGIKLTGDMNVPRGEYSWVAKDIGTAGLVGIAGDEPFTGARMVRCEGHVAGIGYQDATFINSELILISTDVMAHYWKEMGHVSYFRRVDIDALLKT